MAASIAGAVLLVCLLPSASAGRAEVHGADEVAVAVNKELLSQERTKERFASAFADVHSAAKNTCPFGDEEQSMRGGEKPFECHWKSPGMGKTCPLLQAARLRVVRRFQANNHQAFVDKANGYPLSPLFDKSAHLRGDETYEELDKLQIKGLMNPEVVYLEDKINLKALAQKLKTPVTTMYYSAHKSTWTQGDFGSAVEKLCSLGVDGFMIKATHLAWSKGMKIVRGWQADCQKSQSAKEQRRSELTDFIEKEILGQIASEADAHLRLYLEPGVTVEALFRTGGQSRQPLEAKVQVLWGKVHHMFIIGEDARGCRIQSGAWQVYGDKTGWDLSGIIKPGGGNDELGDRVLDKAFDRMVQQAERFATGVQADLMRVDFFLGVPESEDGEWDIVMNECESVSGIPYFHERDILGSMWRDGYVLSDRLSLTEKKWEDLVATTKRDRDAQELD